MLRVDDGPSKPPTKPAVVASPAAGACVCAALAALVAVALPDRARAGEETKAPAWCAPELTALADDVCWYDGAKTGGERTLVIFLHGLIKPSSTWQWGQQRGIVRQAKRFGFSVLAPRGRRGVGPGGMTSVAWPSPPSLNVEPELLGEWSRARKTIDARRGKPFDETFVLGYSNGGYYASSLVLRERLDVDGYAVIAGGSATEELRKAAQSATKRVPVFVGVAMGDKTSAGASRGFGALLEAVRWPHQIHASSAGHEVADRQVERALEYLRAARKKRAP